MTLRHLLGSNFKAANKNVFISTYYLIQLKIICKSRDCKTHSITFLSNAAGLSMPHLKEVYLAEIGTSTVKNSDCCCYYYCCSCCQSKGNIRGHNYICCEVEASDQTQHKMLCFIKYRGVWEKTVRNLSPQAEACYSVLVSQLVDGGSLKSVE